MNTCIDVAEPETTRVGTGEVGVAVRLHTAINAASSRSVPGCGVWSAGACAASGQHDRVIDTSCKCKCKFK